MFFLLSLELCRCSSDLFLSSRPRTGLLAPRILLGMVEARSVNVKKTTATIYLSFIGVRLSINGRILFYWVVAHTLNIIIKDNTIQYSTVVIIFNNTLHPMFTPDPCVAE